MNVESVEAGIKSVDGAFHRNGGISAKGVVRMMENKKK